MNDKITQLEKKVRDLHFNPPRDKRESDDEYQQRKEFLGNFWEHHVLPVMVQGEKLAEKYGADKEIVRLGAMLHDISFVDVGDVLHDELSARRAKEILIQEGFDVEVAEKIANIALAHRSRRFVPQTLEEKVVATADVMAHFTPSFYLGIAMVAHEDYRDLVSENLNKLDHDYREKMFFADEKKEIGKRLETIRRHFGL